MLKLKELEPQAKEKALEWAFAYFNNPKWYEWIFDIASDVGVEIKNFNVETSKIDIQINDLKFTANLISSSVNFKKNDWLKKEAVSFLKKMGKLEEKAMASKISDYDYLEKSGDLEEKFIACVEEYFLKMLKEEYSYLSSLDFIEEVIENNSVIFDERGNPISVNKQ